MPKFSIVIATYNRAGLLAQSLKSIRNQTYSDWETVIVDDGSTDMTREVISSVDDVRMRYIALAINGGATAARNRAIAEANGAYVLVWDSDDELEPFALERLAATFEANPGVGIVSAPAKPLRGGVEQSWKERPEGPISLQQILCKYLSNNEKVRAVRRELFEKAAYRSRNLDFMVNGYLAQQAAWFHLAEPLGILRIDNPDSLTRNRKRHNRELSIERAPHLTAYLEEFGNLLKEACPKRYAAYAYGAALGHHFGRNRKAALRWSSEAVRYAPGALRHLGAYVLIRLSFY